MTDRDRVLDLLTVTTGDVDSSTRLLHLIECQAYAEGFDAGYYAATHTNTEIAKLETEGGNEGWTEPAQETDALPDEALD